MKATPKNLKKCFRPAILRMRGYAPGEQPRSQAGIVKLNTNENPYPPSRAVWEAIRKFKVSDLRLYPDPTCAPLRRTLSEHYNWPADGILVANGSDEILALLFRAAVGKGDVVQMPDLTYSLYPILAAEREGRLRTVPVREEMSLDFSRLDPRARLTLWGYPNPPAGNLFPKKEMESFCRKAKGLALIDEAYADFAWDSCLDIARRHPNVIVLRTLSKSFSLAGLRLGYAFGHPAVLAQLHKVRDSYNVDRLAQAAAQAAFSPAALRETHAALGLILQERTRLRAALGALGFEVPESRANFILARWRGKPNAEAIYLELKARGVLVRYFPLPRLRDRLRITVGSQDQNDRLLTGIRRVIRAKPRRRK